MGFDRFATSDEVLAGCDLADRVVVVTGATSGLGLETARAFASAGATTVLTGRDPVSLAAAQDAVRVSTGNSRVSAQLVDLSSLGSVRRAAESLRQQHAQFDMLIDNAGVMATPHLRSVDGFELQFAVNHLGHFLWTNLLADHLSDSARVVVVSSSAHRFTSVDLEDPNFVHRDYRPWLAYAQSKTANIWFALEFQRRHEDRGVSAFSVHPGAIRTQLQRHVTEEARRDLRKLVGDAPKPPEKSVEQGAATSCWAATAPSLQGHGGSYLENCSVSRPSNSHNPREGHAPWSYDTDRAEQLWQLSERLTR